MRWFAPVALLADGPRSDVVIDVVGGRIAALSPGAAPDGARRLPGVVLPGFANVHSHAFHRALRGRTHLHGGTFWTWREQMYRAASLLDPDSYFLLARAVYAEMALAGITTVGEFHYLHHRADGRAYADPNAMGAALVAAAHEAGIRITLLDACYLSADVDGAVLTGVQRQFGDAGVDAWSARVSSLRDADGVRHGFAAHSVRAVPAAALGEVARVAGGRPLHVHVSEQPAENDACLAEHGRSPLQLLADHGVLGPATTAVHAVHIAAPEIALLATSGSGVCVCPSTEHDLADGIAPAAQLRSAGVPLALGSDLQVLIDPFGEAQLLEGDQRAISLQRGTFAPFELLSAMTAHRSLGWDDAGELAVGSRADFVAVRTNTVRTAGVDPAQIVLAASAADVDTVVVDGMVVVDAGRHRLGDVGALLGHAIGMLR